VQPAQVIGGAIVVVLAACGDDDVDQTFVGCETAASGAIAQATRGDEFEGAEVLRAELTTLGAVDDANPTPLQHPEGRIRDMPVCAFVVEGDVDGEPQLRLVVLEPDDATGEGFDGTPLFGQAVESDTEPGWWSELVPRG
jgi:hypothetical protein